MRVSGRIAALLLLVACSPVRVESAPAFEPAAVESYAWSEASTLPSSDLAVETQAAETSAVDDPALLARARTAVDEELARRGIRKVDASQAAFLVQVSLGIETKVQQNDPYYSLFVAEKYEEGRLTIRLLDRATGAPAWSGECRQRLRYVARAFGGMTLRFEPVDEPRDWQLERMASRILSKLRAAPG